MSPPSSLTKLSLTNNDSVLDAFALRVSLRRDDGSPIPRVLEIDVADKSYKSFALVRGIDNAEPAWAVGETIAGTYYSVHITSKPQPDPEEEYIRETYPALAAGLSII